jgi:sialate O-acetylesterase
VIRVVASIVCLLALAAPARAADAPGWGRIVASGGITDRQVVQRGDDGKASISVSGSAHPAGGAELAYRVLRRGQTVDGFDWAVIPVSGDGAWKVNVNGLPTGGPFQFEFRLRDANGKELDRRDVDDVLVGDLWVLAGQSNMDGCGDLRDAEAPHEMVRDFNLADDWQVAEDPMHWCYEALYPVYLSSYVSPTERRPIPYAPRGPWPTWQRPEGQGAGLGIPFGKQIHRETGVPVGLILCSLGGTTMAQWSPDLKDKGGASMYGAMIARIAKVGGKVKGLLWYQGESDSYPADVSAKYGANLSRLIGAIRSDLNDPDMPAYVVQVGRQIVSPGADPHGRHLVREAQRLVTRDVPHTGVASAIDLRMSSGAHLDTDGYKRIGRRLANVALAKTYGVKRIAEGPTLDRVSVEGPKGDAIRITFANVNGKLAAPPRVSGFSIRTRDGSKELAYYLEAIIDPASPNSIVIHVGQPVPKDASLWYGHGWDPVCNVVDDQDMAAPAFGPIPLE